MDLYREFWMDPGKSILSNFRQPSVPMYFLQGVQPYSEYQGFLFRPVRPQALPGLILPDPLQYEDLRFVL